MPSTIETAAARFAVVLGGVRGISGVYRDRQDAFSREEGSCILVEVAADDAQSHGGAPHVDRADARLAVVYLTRGAQWQTEIDRMREEGHSLITTDAQLVKLLTGLRRDSARWQAASADLPFGHCVQQYRAVYLSSTTQLRRVP